MDIQTRRWPRWIPSIHPDQVSSVVTDECAAFFRRLSPLSHFYDSQLKMEGITFSWAEEYYVHQKAIHYSGNVSAARVLRTTEPGTVKSIGNISIQPNSDWNKKRAVIRAVACGGGGAKGATAPLGFPVFVGFLN